MNKRKVGATIILLVIVTVFGFGAFKLAQFWQWRESKREDRVGYRIVIKSDGAHNVILRVPAPYKDGKLMAELTDNLAQRKDVSDVVTIEEEKLAMRVVDTEYGQMLEVSIEELNGRLWLEGLVVDKKHQIVVLDDEGLNMWLNPYFFNGNKIPSEGSKRVQFGGDGKRETRIYASYDGEPIYIEKIGLGVGEDTLLGPRYFDFYVSDLSLDKEGWHKIQLNEWGTTTY